MHVSKLIRLSDGVNRVPETFSLINGRELRLTRMSFIQIHTECSYSLSPIIITIPQQSNHSNDPPSIGKPPTASATMTKMKFYDAQAPNPYVVRLFVLEPGGLQFDVEQIDIMALENRKPAYRRNVNPCGELPALRLSDGSFLTEITAICE
jgi:hypothetical protein